MKNIIVLSQVLLLSWIGLNAQTNNTSGDTPVYDSSVPTPTLKEIKYGNHERHVVDFWKADSDKPTPLVFVIHGGGWNNGSKEKLHKFVNTKELLDQGISVVAINYRLMRDVGDEKPPVKVPMMDIARALQFVRTKAKEWNIDKNKIAASGGSAGACSSLWLAYHDDLAKPESYDPIERESTRIMCAAVKAPQTTLDPQQMKDWTPNSKYGGHAFGKKGFKNFLAAREEIMPWIMEYSPYHLVTKEDPPIYMFYGDKPAIGEEKKDPTHTSNFGLKLKEHCEEIGVQADLYYRGLEGAKHETTTAYLIEVLKK